MHIDQETVVGDIAGEHGASAPVLSRRSARRAAGRAPAARPVHDRAVPSEPGLPAAFAAFVVDRPPAGGFVRGLRELGPGDLPEGELTIRVAWSSVNYKDGLAAREDGRIARVRPLVPGIDLAGVVVASADPSIPAGTEVLAHGYEIGVARHGGYAAYARIPSAWAVPIPPGLGPRGAMVVGTAGFTAAMAVAALEERGLRPGDGPVVVTGASGGVGSAAIAILAARGHEAWASTGKAGEVARLRALGAAGIVAREELVTPERPLERARWAGAIDAVGAPALPGIIAALRPGSAVAACGNAGGAELATSVLPFILRGVALLGMDSAALPIGARRDLWSRIAGDLRPRGLEASVVEVGLDGLEDALDAIHAGRVAGRIVVRVGA